MRRVVAGRPNPRYGQFRVVNFLAQKSRDTEWSAIHLLFSFIVGGECSTKFPFERTGKQRLTD